MDVISHIKSFLQNARKYHIDYSLLLTTGSALTLGLLVGWKLRRDLNRRKEKYESGDFSSFLDSINVSDIADLAACEKIKVKKCAEQILLDRAVRANNLDEILKCCLSADLKTARMAVAVVGMLVRCSDFKDRLIAAGSIQALVNCLCLISGNNDFELLKIRCKQSPYCYRITEDVMFGLSELLSAELQFLTESFYSDNRRFVTDIVLNVMCDHSRNLSYPTRTYAVLLLNQLSQCSSSWIHEKMIEDHVHAKAADCFMKTLGDKILTQCLLQIIVTIAGESNKYDMNVLIDVGKYKPIAALTGCIKSDNQELVYWALELIHEFAQKDLFKHEICRQPGIIKTLTIVLKESEACVQAIVLRIFSYLALLNEDFQQKILQSVALIKHLSICLASGVPNVFHWALVLVHDIARGGRTATEKLLSINMDLVKNVITHTLSDNYITMRTALETLGFFYPCDKFHEQMFVSGSMKIFINVSTVDDKDIREWAAAFLVRISMSSDEARRVIVTDGCIYPLMQLAARADDANMAWEFTRTLVMVGFLDSMLNFRLKSGSESSILVDGREYSPCKDGLNIVTFDVSTYKFSGSSFSLVSEENIQHCKDFLSNVPEWCPIFISVQGCGVEFWHGLSKLKEEISALLPAHGSYSWDMAFCLLSIKSEMFKDLRLFKSCQDNVELESSIGSLGVLVSVAVLHNLVIPLMDIFMSVPATSNISKVSELESLTILAQQSCLVKAMVATPGFLEHLNELIWNFVAVHQNEIMEKPLKLVHCIGAMKIIHLISANTELQNELLMRNTVDATLSLLLTLTQVSITNVEEVIGMACSESPLPSQVLAVTKRCPSLSHYYAVDEKEESRKRGVGRGHSIVTSGSSGAGINYDILQLHADHPEVSRTDVEPVGRVATVEEEEAASADEVKAHASNSNVVGFPSEEHVSQCSTNAVFNIQPLSDDSENNESDFEEELIQFAFDEDDEDLNITAENGAGRQERSRFWRESTTHFESDSRGFPSSPGRALSGALSRSLTESSFRVKSPMKNLTTDLESFSEATENLTDYVISTLYHLLSGSEEATVEKATRRSRSYLLLQSLALSSSPTLNQKIRTSSSYILCRLFYDNSMGSSTEKESVVLLKRENATPNLTVGNDQLTVRNGSWTFETACASRGVSKNMTYLKDIEPKGWYFEVLLLSKGILQIGWLSDNREFSVEKGVGVGDVPNSVAFDGFRCKVLNGSPKECDALDYGKEWYQNDHIGCLLSRDGDVSFTINGESLGIAVRGIDTSKLWYPAVSLTCSNQCRLSFSADSLRYKPPPGYIAIQEDTGIQTNRESLETKKLNTETSESAFPKKQVRPVPIPFSQSPLDEVENRNEIFTSKRVDELMEVDEECRSIAIKGYSPPADIVSHGRRGHKRSTAAKVLFPLSFDYRGEEISDSVAAYYEVLCCPERVETFEIGYIATDGSDTRQTFKICCDMRKITSCSEDIYDEAQTFESFDYVGCAVLLPSAKVLLTVDGVPSNYIPSAPSDEKSARALSSFMPAISTTELAVNFGEDSFVFRHCNLSDVRLKMAKLHMAIVLAEDQDIS